MSRARQMARTRPSPKSLFLEAVLAPKVYMGGDCIQPGQPMGKLGSQAVKNRLKALVASDTKNNNPLSVHYEGLPKYSYQL